MYVCHQQVHSMKPKSPNLHLAEWCGNLFWDSNLPHAIPHLQPIKIHAQGTHALTLVSVGSICSLIYSHWEGGGCRVRYSSVYLGICQFVCHCGRFKFAFQHCQTFAGLTWRKQSWIFDLSGIHSNYFQS